MDKKYIWIIIVIGILGILLKMNIYDKDFYSVSFGRVQFHVPESLIEVSYVDASTDTSLVFNEEDELAIWNDFVKGLNEASFVKKNSTIGSSFNGAIITMNSKELKRNLELHMEMKCE